MNDHDRPMTRLEAASGMPRHDLFAAVDAEVDERFLDLARTDLRVRVLSHGSGAPLLLLHGGSFSAAAWARCSPNFRTSGCSRWTSRARVVGSGSLPARPAFASTRTG